MTMYKIIYRHKVDTPHRGKVWVKSKCSTHSTLKSALDTRKIMRTMPKYRDKPKRLVIEA